ncbi:MAG: cytochrome C, partial [Bacteroidales bacterium]|nr:cytochrome C [Bacteroidales bacterium]
MNRHPQTYKPITGICLVLFFFVVQLSGQISPGDLSAPHAHLNGLSNCTKCHTLGKKVSNEKCLDCHLAIGIRISESRGYHSSTEVKGKGCIKCHSDHHGLKFQMIRFDTDQFDHALTGYNLHGTHAEINCKTCHKIENIADPKIKLKSSTYLGLDQKCLSCHTDYHQGTLSSDCSSCHDFKEFRPASKFDHKKSRFPLRGKHAGVDCKLCHKVSVQNGKEMQKFTGLTFGKCTSCHQDVHNNKFGQNCTQCHSEASFHQVKGMKDFNHSRTNYPLVGKHRTVACASCHKSGYSKQLKYNRCSDCHKDYHNKQFAIQGKSPDCSDCHSTLGFEQSSFTLERHNDSQFKLTGAHLATPCFACHRKNDKWSFREIGKKCIDCHKNIHESSLDKKYDPEPRCVNCHDSKRWSEIVFDHSKTGYKLEGSHLRQSCRSCHFKPGEQGIVIQQFSQLSTSCTECHKDAHQKQFEESTGTSCLKCHDYFDWKAGLFDHNQTAFPLDGKHKNVACVKCHP